MLSAIIVSAAAFAACAGVAAQESSEAEAAPSPPPWSWPDTMDNAEVLPPETGGEDLRGVMLAFTGALGVRCSHCHVANGDDLNDWDFASDANPRKDVTRRMMRMTRSINADHIAELDGYPDARVNCFTCHRGSTRPLTSAPDES